MSAASRGSTVAAGAGAPAYTEALPREAQSAAAARRLVRTVLGAWHLPELAECAALVVTEMVANAADHARGEAVRVTVTRISDHRVRVAVVDMDRARPQVRPLDANAERGRGMRLIEAHSAGWGVDPLPWGKRVWADLGAS